MIITEKILKHFAPRCDVVAEFTQRFPDGLDVSGLWGAVEQRDATWEHILRDEFLRKYIGWAIDVGILPARISANLRGVNLYGANLRRADLRGADLRGADLHRANLYGANLYGADLYEANLHRANLNRADLRWANLNCADLSCADLNQANLRWANLTDGQRKYAEKQGAILQ